MFLGEYSYTIDHKKRLAIPSKFRKELGKKAIVTRGLDNSLVVYPAEEWEKLAKNLGNLPSSQTEARGFVRIMLSGAAEVNFDKLGRVLIPDYLKEYSSLRKNAVIIGLYNRIEIWSEENWQSYKARTEKEVGNIAERLKELGI
ncbi:MAG: cell division/cell wall cluster transcriptional repressor MraZ [Parcubacteria group bacterium CG11_big_fil_rev_8_21_14_0_20_39_14]|nr:MAG: cell division/cell wall cluster transcriptional repressor MraZ [Parcubacteria group bacterium CG11_big_fil_rev_8_21_14_0_20_39_14]PIS35446.1 MAG: cell division/cell wall cluster transcriptional repressor MraZ [Parcubacteria group bacterium CG08_land_8_20_14_0_20_38_56]